MLSASNREPKRTRGRDGPSEALPRQHADTDACAKRHRPTPIFRSTPNNREPSNSPVQGQPRLPQCAERAAVEPPRLPGEARVAGLALRPVEVQVLAAGYQHTL